MSKPKLNLTNTGTTNESIVGFIESQRNGNDEFVQKLKQYIDNDIELFKLIWDEYDIVFDNYGEQDILSQDIYSNESYVRNSKEYFFMLDYIMKIAHSYTKNGHTPKRTNFR